MAVLAWLAVPVVATLIALVWVAFVNRPRRPATMNESMDRFERFRSAMVDRVLGSASARTTSGERGDDRAPNVAAESPTDELADRDRARRRAS